MKRIIQNLSLYLQRDNLSLADAYTRVESAKTTLTQLLDKEARSVSAVLDGESFSDERLVFKGCNATSSQMDGTIRQLLSSLDARFPSSELVSATLVTSFKNWPHMKQDEFKDSTFGEKEVAVLYKQFSPVVFSVVDVSLEAVSDERSTLLSLVYMKYPEMKDSLQWHTSSVICRTIVLRISSV